MLKLYNGSDMYPLQINETDWYIEHSYDGYDTLCFEIPDSHDMYPYLAEEARITDGDNLYAVKQLDDHGGYVNVTCSIDLDDWRERFWKSYRKTDSTLQQVFDDIKPQGWRLEGAGEITNHATIEASEGKGLENTTAEVILGRASEVYGVVFNFDALSKVVHVVDPSRYTPSGDYLTDELNLKALGYTGSTKDLVTRLYAYGKKDNDGNPVTIASVNDGKEYLDNNQYSDRVISAAWNDERYTSPESLLAAAREKLDALSYPVRSYECDVRNLGGNMFMYKVVTLIDRKRKIRTDHRVVAYKEYPKAHFYDVVTLSAVPPKIEGTVKSISAEVEQKISTAAQTATDAALEALQVITGAMGGHVKILMENGLPEAIEITHADGSTTLANKDGLTRGGNPYVYLIQQGTLDIDPESGGSVQLPNDWIGHEAEICVGVRNVLPQDETSVLHSLSLDSSWDAEHARAQILASCDMLSVGTGELIAPKNIEVNYCIIGR